jgi:D-arabinose 1-dehydrogenase-like Zn-dependent alcohol dehydrogenase
MPSLRAFHFTAPSTPLAPLTRDLPAPGPGAVRVRIQACGICHGDALATTGHFPGIAYPVIPGHEIAGVIDAVGTPLPPGANWSIGDRVGVGWNGGFCGQCANCRRGDAFACLTENRVTGLTQDGGYPPTSSPVSPPSPAFPMPSLPKKPPR